MTIWLLPLLLLLSAFPYGAAHAASASVTVTVTGGGGGTTPCTIGPPYVGAIPAVAIQAFGATPKCTGNYDFTQTQQWTDQAGTHQWSNLSTWLFGLGNNTTSPYLANINGPNSVSFDTSHQFITTDGGTQVFGMTYTLTDKNAGNYSNTLTTVDSGAADPRNPFGPATYIEAVYRIVDTTNPCGTNNCTIIDLSQWAYQPTGKCFPASDQETESGYATGAGISMWNNAPCNSATPGCNTNGITACGVGVGVNNIGPPSVIDTQYYTRGRLMTVDTTNNKAALNNYVVQGVFSGLSQAQAGSNFTNSGVANPATIPADASVGSTNVHVYYSVGPQILGSTFGAVNWSATSMTAYLRRFTVWECQTRPCINTPVITTPP